MKELSPEDKMIKARVQLLLNHPFFGYFLTHLRFKSTNSIITQFGQHGHYLCIQSKG